MEPMEFLEDLTIAGETCPPVKAVSGRFAVYRLVDGVPIRIEDVWSYRVFFPAKIFKDECIARACSVYTKCEDVKNLRKFPKFRKKTIILIPIKEHDGVLLKTFEKSHYSWWISRAFDLTAVKEVV
jgi:hypothetical protein